MEEKGLASVEWVLPDHTDRMILELFILECASLL